MSPACEACLPLVFLGVLMHGATEGRMALDLQPRLTCLSQAMGQSWPFKQPDNQFFNKSLVGFTGQEACLSAPWLELVNFGLSCRVTTAYFVAAIGHVVNSHVSCAHRQQTLKTLTKVLTAVAHPEVTTTCKLQLRHDCCVSRGSVLMMCKPGQPGLHFNLQAHAGLHRRKYL